MNVYIAGPMRGLPNFNFPAFFAAEQHLVDEYSTTYSLWIFNPARRDEEMYGRSISNSPTGDLADIPQFSLREALGADLNWICENATHLWMLQGWSTSKGAKAEFATALALGIDVLGAFG